MTIFLYISLIFVWGASWIAIAWQAGDVSPVVSVFYRFASSAAIMFPIMKMLGKIERTNMIDHAYFVGHGACLFGLNFICFYYASQYLMSGLLAIIFSTATLWNVLNMYFWFKEKPLPQVKWGVLFGLLGLLMLFWNDVSNVNLDVDLLKGVGLTLLGVYIFSLGNMISVRNNRMKISAITSTSYALIYSSVILLGIILLIGAEFKFNFSPLYIGSWLFLVFAATIFGFTAYIELIKRIGVSHAPYILVITPLVALGLSTIFEDYQWTLQAIIGVMLIAVGNVVVQYKQPQKK